MKDETMNENLFKSGRGKPLSEFDLFFNKHILFSESNNNLTNIRQDTCPNVGAEWIVLGINQAKAYCQFDGIPFKPARSRNLYQFGSGLQTSIDSIATLIPISNQNLIIHDVEIVNLNISFIIKLNTLT